MVLPSAFPNTLVQEASRAISRFAGHQRVLEAMALRQPLSEVLTRLVRAIEDSAHGAIGSVLLLDETGTRLQTGAAPGLPAAYSAAIHGAPIGQAAGSCGTAAFRRERVIVSDIATDPLWDDYRHLAQEHGLRACWSTPIISAEGRVLGTFAMYADVPRVPSDEEIAVIDEAVDLASVAIQLAQADVQLRRSEQQLQHAQRMEAVGRMAGGIAHDFNNVLTVISGNVSLALAELPGESPVADLLLEAREASQRASTLARQLLTVSRREPVTLHVLDVNAEVQALEKMLRRLIGEHVSLHTHYAAVPCRVYADRTNIEQVVLNLVLNARDAMPTGGRIDVRTRVHTVSPADAAELGVAPGRMVVLEVHDAGAGMDDETQSRAFEPFFTTKVAGEGTGLGLATVYAIAVRHGGRATIRSAPGAGSTISVWLPATDRPVAEVPVPETPAVVAHGVGTVLLVEDEDSVRTLARRVLAGRGYRVFEARHGLEALELWRDHARDIDLVVTDVVMPHLGGPALVERLRQERPALPVVFCSGYSDAAPAPDDDTTAFLSKPFSIGAFMAQVQRVLAR